MPGTEASAAAGDWRSFRSTRVLRSGAEIVIRAVRPEDKERFRAAFRSLDSTSVYTRFFGYRSELSEAELEQATNVDFDRVVALVSTTGSAEQETIIGGARYVTHEPPLKSAEVAFTVEEDYQGLGIATAFLQPARPHCSCQGPVPIGGRGAAQQPADARRFCTQRPVHAAAIDA